LCRLALTIPVTILSKLSSTARVCGVEPKGSGLECEGCGGDDRDERFEMRRIRRIMFLSKVFFSYSWKGKFSL